jgi:hypothetical protein
MCEICLSKTSIHGKGLAAVEGVGNAITPEEAKTHYNCKTCHKRVYVVVGDLYKGECFQCLGERSGHGAGLKLVEGVGN